MDRNSRVIDDRERGAVLVEFALVLILFLVLLFGLIDYGLGVNTLTQLNNAGREGARLATVNPDPVAVEARARSSAAELDQAILNVTLACEDPIGVPCAGAFPPGDLRNGVSGDKAIVTLDYRYDLVTPLPTFINSDGKFDLKSTTEMRIE